MTPTTLGCYSLNAMNANQYPRLTGLDTRELAETIRLLDVAWESIQTTNANNKPAVRELLIQAQHKIQRILGKVAGAFDRHDGPKSPPADEGQARGAAPEAA